MNLVIGIDFDNTLICYDEIFHSVAVREGWISPAVPSQKKAIRDAIQNSREGDSRWQQLQTLAYGIAIDQARLYEGVPLFFQACRKRGLSVFIVSHKTETAWLHQQPVQLRQQALQWMQSRGFFAPEGFGLKPEQVYFESSRSEKISRIRALRCTHFIDDLAEVFAEPSFPPSVAKILFAPTTNTAGVTDVRAFDSWVTITDWFSRTNGEGFSR
jgi:hypothetical protein